MFEVRIETTFEAAHSRGPDGAEAPLHHHEWKVAVRASSEDLDHIGIVVDFRILRAAADKVVAQLDQRVLEDVDGFSKTAPTPAAVAEWIFDGLEDHFRSATAEAAGKHDFRLEAVAVEADPGMQYEYIGG